MSILLDGTLGTTTPAETVQGALTTTGNTILGDASTDTLNVGNGGLVKDASGNVGIGTASPMYQLQVGSTSGNLALGGALTTNATSRLKFLGSNTVINWQISQNDSISGAFEITPSTVAGGSTFTTPTAVITSAGLLQFNSGYGSAATAYGCRAWVNFNGTGTVAIRASGNVSSITDNGVGMYDINFTNAMPDANYSFQGSRSYRGVFNAENNTTTYARTYCAEVDAPFLSDATFIYAAIFR